MQLTEQQVLALAPDSGSAGNGKKLAQTKNWPTLGRSARALWGECQGSGSKPYQVRVDLADFASKCSCPSFKFPCKHALGLLVLTANQPDLLQEHGEPEWVGDWLDKRGETAAKKEAKAAAKAEAPVDEAAQQKRSAKRNDRVADGLAALQLWLDDQVRNGLARLPAEGPALFEQQAARLVDAQAAALAGRLRALADLPGGPTDWPQQLLGELGRLALTIRAFEHIDSLPAELQHSLRAAIGYTLKEEDILSTATPWRDEWLVIGQALDQDERVRVQRSWLQGRQSGQLALLLQFAVGTQPFAQRWLPGSSFAAELAFWPGAHPQRAMLKGTAEPATAPSAFTHRHSIDALLLHAAQALASQPWLERVALMLADLTPVRHHERWYAAQPDGQALPLARGDYWHWLAIGGGAPHDTAVEWDGRVLRPLGWFDNGRYYPLGEAAWTN
ncbi:MAG TPA: SWIM zinc finger family protein [Chitinolyticbacter sp.]|nr:SWIM zinc finger family protein [Chitinolyticbacter sp.]